VILSPTVHGTPYPYPPLNSVRRHLGHGSGP
jgi:hypothetical protein